MGILLALAVLGLAACAEGAGDALPQSRAEDAAQSECDLDVEPTAVVFHEDDETTLYEVLAPGGLIVATVIVDVDDNVLSVGCSDFSVPTPVRPEP